MSYDVFSGRDRWSVLHRWIKGNAWFRKSRALNAAMIDAFNDVSRSRRHGQKSTTERLRLAKNRVIRQSTKRLRRAASRRKKEIWP